MEKQYWIRSYRYSIQTRKDVKEKNNYSVRFMIYDKTTGSGIKKRLSGFSSKNAAIKAYHEFISINCDLVTEEDYKEQNENIHMFPFVAAVVENYLGDMSGSNKCSTIRDKRSAFKNHIVPELGRYRLDELSPEVLTRWYNDLVIKNNPNSGIRYSTSKINQIRNFLNSFLEWANDNYCVKNNLKAVKKKKISTENRGDKVFTGNYTIWTEDEFQKFASVIDDPVYKAFFTFLFYTGRREGEIMALSPKDVSGSYVSYEKSITPKGNNKGWDYTTTKAGKNVTLKISPKVLDALEEYKRTEYYDDNAGFLFGGERPLAFATMRKRFALYKKLSGVKDIRIHDLRHSFVSRAIHEGASLSVVAHLISDREEQVVKTYAHMYKQNDIDSIVDKL